MTQSSDPARPISTATFHARVAGVGLITTVVVLFAACSTFMLQQWAVARAQSEALNRSLAQIAAASAADAIATGETNAYRGAVAALAASPQVLAVRLQDAQGRTLVAVQGSRIAATDPKLVQTDVRRGLRLVGRLSMTVAQPKLSRLLPQFVALTAILLFGGVGVALFLARGLAHRVIAPVQRLSDAMNAVAAGGRFEPVDVQTRVEPFRSLTASFNHLLAKLGEREEDLKRAMRELEMARDAANAANVLKTQFLANMSHEIRTPLNGVLAMAEVMAMGELDKGQRDRLDVIRQSGALLLAVLNDVLDLSKIEAGKLSLLVEDFDLDPTVAAVLETYRVQAEAKGLELRFKLAKTARGWWRGDAERIKQILGNLLSNAIKFTPKGSVALAIDVDPASQALRIAVRDTGVGIASEKLATLFEKFTQADNSATRRFGGTGLGLVICRELTQMMGGSIEVASREGRGATFTAVLPLARGEPAAQAAPAPPPPQRGQLRLLAAEDNATNREVLSAVMTSLGLDLDLVNDGREAVEAWRLGGYDLILMDIQMPVMDGVDAAREIRRLEVSERRARTPILAVTANALTHQIEEYLAAGMDGHVPKPIEIAKLYDAISTALSAAAQPAGRSRKTSAA